jgi:hypothetical protein
LAWASEVGQEFLDAVCTGDTPAAAAVMAPAARRKLAPPMTDSDKERGYDDFRLGNLFKERRTGATTYTAQAATITDNVVTLTGELRGAAKPLTFTVKLTPDGVGWVVTSFETKPGA